MGTLEGMNIKMNIGSFSLEEDGFSAVTDEFENPFEKEDSGGEEEEDGGGAEEAGL